MAQQRWRHWCRLPLRLRLLLPLLSHWLLLLRLLPPLLLRCFLQRVQAIAADSAKAAPSSARVPQFVQNMAQQPSPANAPVRRNARDRENGLMIA
jgi:hypothetical protein